MSHDENCVFCKIVKGQLPCREVWQNDYCLAFHDLYPKAKTHVLVIPKHHICGIADLQDKDKSWPRYIIGGSIFGLGWALTGACPGPMFVNIGYGYLAMIIVVIGALSGTYLYGLIKDKLPH